jgi:hypothetical protein
MSSRTGYHAFLSEVMLSNPRLSFGDKSRLASQQWAMMSLNQKESYAVVPGTPTARKNAKKGSRKSNKQRVVVQGGNWFSSEYSPDFDPQYGRSKTKPRTWGQYLENIV